MSNNPFNQGRNAINIEMMKNYKTSPIIKYSLSAFCGLASFILLIILLGPSDIHLPRLDSGINPYFHLSYGIMWAIGFGVLVFNTFLTALFIRLLKDVKIDVIPLVLSFSFAIFSYWILPVKTWLFFLLIPLFAIIGFFIGIVCVLFYSVYKFAKQAKENPDQNPFNSMGPNGPFSTDQQLGTEEENLVEEKHEDNPFVDLDDYEDKDD